MEVYRLAHARFADLSGKGGLYGSGRWHHKGHPILYTASSRALAALERFVHESASTLPPLKMLTLWLPDHLSIDRYTEHQLPDGWDQLPDTEASRDFGAHWLQQNQHAALQVPSAIVRGDYNLIINPLHPQVRELKVVEEVDFYYDQRLQRMMR